MVRGKPSHLDARLTDITRPGQKVPSRAAPFPHTGPGPLRSWDYQRSLRDVYEAVLATLGAGDQGARRLDHEQRPAGAGPDP